MSITLRRKTGAAIAIVGAIVAAIAALSGVRASIAVAIAMICIVIGTGVARRYFSSAPNGHKGN